MTITNHSVAKTRTKEQTAGYVQAEISRGAVATLGVAGAFIGMWSFASIVGALIVTGGPVSLIQSWFGAVIGM